MVRHWSLKNHNGRFRFPLLPGDEHINERIEAFPDASPDEVKRFSDEYRRKMVLWAAEQVRPDFKESTWEAFWKTAIQHVPVKQVAAGLQMSEGAVYIARSRVMAAIKKVVAELDGDLDFPSEAPDAG